ncbi:CU044_2847 family protein [Kitasatospora phosalacinea]|uniref:CU044_2847 family protein n=1 Tax=Kitasatospora phosalacinea TaxID=2065 RepID=A0ABW6GX98_9ACTN
MPELFTIPLDDGGHLTVEVAEEAGGIQRVGRGPDAVRHGAETFQEAVGRIRPALASVVGQIRSLADAPERVTVEFGIKLTAEAGVVIARTATEANFTITAEWQRASPTPADGQPARESVG